MKFAHLQCLLIITCLTNSLLLGHKIPLAAFDTFDEERTHLVDYNGTTQNMLFRGDIPRSSSNTYRRDSLIRSLQNTFKKFTQVNNKYKKDHFPKKYRLVVISMMTLETKQEVDFLKIIFGHYAKKIPDLLSIDDIPFETRYSKRDGDHWYWWWVRANLTHAPPFPEDVTFKTLAQSLDLSSSEINRVLVSQSWDGYTLNFVELIELLKTYMETEESEPYIIYLHSRNGINRSGATDVAYKMRVYGTDIEVAWNDSIYQENGSKLEYYRPQEAKTFLMYYKAYLDSL